MLGIFVFTSILIPRIYAYGPNPPPPDHGQTGNQESNDVLIGGGTFILMFLGTAYGGRRFMI
ncbi:MAG: hypothetical protein K9I94_15590 [Bacteroidales bacterium]|nr:hypothetical protein [Bacteroidales bacterium]